MGIPQQQLDGINILCKTCRTTALRSPSQSCMTSYAEKWKNLEHGEALHFVNLSRLAYLLHAWSARHLNRRGVQCARCNESKSASSSGFMHIPSDELRNILFLCDSCRKDVKENEPNTWEAEYARIWSLIEEKAAKYFLRVAKRLTIRLDIDKCDTSRPPAPAIRLDSDSECDETRPPASTIRLDSDSDSKCDPARSPKNKRPRTVIQIESDSVANRIQTVIQIESDSDSEPHSNQSFRLSLLVRANPGRIAFQTSYILTHSPSSCLHHGQIRREAEHLSHTEKCQHPLHAWVFGLL